MRQLVSMMMAAVALCAGAEYARAGLLVGESFDGAAYTAGASLNGLNGGTGWGDAWTASSHANFPQDIQSGNLADVPGLVNSGNHARLWACGNGSVYSKASRPFAATIPDAGQTLWLGLQVAANDAKEGPSRFYLRDDGAGDSFLRVRSEANTRVQASQDATLFLGDDNYTPHLILVKIEMSGDAGDENLTYYLDPDLSAAPTGGTVQSASWNNGLTGFKWDGPRASTSMACDMFLDEMRLATTWQEAVGISESSPEVPEPASAVLVFLGFSAVACRLRRSARHGR